MSVDVEDWFHILEVDGGYTRSDWGGLEPRVVENTERLLGLFTESGAEATFFVVGWVAVRFPDLVRRIVEAGHEVASHSYWHEVVARHDRKSLAADLERSKKILEDLSGQPVEGFRAPGGSITAASAWAFDVIVEQGFRYDSSLCPGYMSHGGFESPFHVPHRIRCTAGELLEMPLSTVGVGRWRFPYAGGGYLRLLPYEVVRACIRREERRGSPASVYVHPREIDVDQPRMTLPPLRRFKYYVGLRGAEAKLRALLRDHRFTSARTWLAQHAELLTERVLDARDLIAGAEPSADPSVVPPTPPLASAGTP
jgi:polysaccharide deacetylase family protein (PEP-CTERM system associated)